MDRLITRTEKFIAEAEADKKLLKLVKYRFSGCREVEEFMNKMEIPMVTADTYPSYMVQRLAYITEEVAELATATARQDIPAIADALIDIVYFVKGTSVALGLPWEEMWDAVHEANMSKVAGKSKRGLADDASKPVDWQAPDLATLILHYGINPEVLKIGGLDA